MTKLSLAFAERNGTTLFGDFYRPDGDHAVPAVLAVPGGGWLRGRREQLVHWGEYLAAQGFGCFAIDYRRSDQGAIYPENAQDVRAGLQYLHAQSTQLGIDRQHIGLIAASAGAHLGALTALDEEQPQVDVLVLAYGVYDIADHYADFSGDQENLVERMMGTTPHANPQLFREASPLRRISKVRAKQIKALLIWGTNDDVVPPAQSKDFAQALSNAGALVEVEPVEGAGHFWFSNEPIDREGSFAAAIAPKVARFLKQHLT